MEDIYDGKTIQIWEDKEGIVFINIFYNGTTVSMPKGEFKTFMKEIKTINI